MSLMNNNDRQEQANAIRQKIADAVKANDAAAFSAALTEYGQCIEENILAEAAKDADARIKAATQSIDAEVLRSRGVRQLTSAETGYWQKVTEAMKSTNPKQALEDLDVVMPETVIDSVFEDLRANHPLLNAVNFRAVSGHVRMMMNTDGINKAQWGELCDEIVKEILSGFKEVDSGLFKLSAFIPICNSMLDLGPQWLDRYIREILYEALANGLEDGIINGDGDKQPIGMIRQVGDDVTVTGGKYPAKAAVEVTDFSPETLGNLMSLLAAGPNGKYRTVSGLILLVNPQDYFRKVMPATTIMAPDGTYRNNILPYPVQIIQSFAVGLGEAIFGIGRRYFGSVASGYNRSGRIEYSDSYRFLEDQRVYRIKLLANGFPLDNSSFLRLDISGLQPPVLRTQTVTAPAASTNANLASLSITGGKLNPAFAAATDNYTMTTTKASGVVLAVPADSAADVVVKAKIGADGTPTEIVNGSSVTWKTGADNVITVEVTAEDGTTKETYTVTVTKS